MALPEGASQEQKWSLSGLQKQLVAGKDKLGVVTKQAAERRAELDAQRRKQRELEERRKAGTTEEQKGAALAERVAVRLAQRKAAAMGLQGGTSLAAGRGATREATESSAKARLGAAALLEQRKKLEERREGELADKVHAADTAVSDEQIAVAGKETEIATETFKAKQDIAAGIENKTKEIEKMIADTAGMVLEDEDLKKMRANLKAMTAASPQEAQLIDKYLTWVEDALKTNWWGKGGTVKDIDGKEILDSEGNVVMIDGQTKIEDIMG